MKFEELNVWKLSFEVAYLINKYSRTFSDTALKDQMRRASVSVVSNIAEGEERETVKESVRFLYIAKGSNGELLAQTKLAHRLGYLSDQVTRKLEGDIGAVGRMLAGLIKSRSGKVK